MRFGKFSKFAINADAEEIRHTSGVGRASAKVRAGGSSAVSHDSFNQRQQLASSRKFINSYKHSDLSRQGLARDKRMTTELEDSRIDERDYLAEVKQRQEAAIAARARKRQLMKTEMGDGKSDKAIDQAIRESDIATKNSKRATAKTAVQQSQANAPRPIKREVEPLSDFETRRRQMRTLSRGAPKHNSLSRGADYVRPEIKPRIGFD